jgi:acyl-CoA synthetase (AMP-forming)/AMP-acid ligase II
MTDTVLRLLESGRDGDPAVLASGREPLTFGELRARVEGAVTSLRAHGIGLGDRVAIALPNGPELATLFLAVAGCAVAAPLNPALTATELEFALRNLGVRALVVPEADTGPPRAVAESLGLTVIGLRVARSGKAGEFQLSEPARSGRPAAAGFPEAEDVALVLHTSGTTARPKIVLLRHRHLAASARHIRATLQLSPADRCLNVMPLFHIHGLAACLLAPLGAGGSVFCGAGFNALRFFAELAVAQATWYSAVPTMHQAILARAPRQAERLAHHGLRFVRSSSSALPPSVLRALESVFAVPAIEAYGMTEAAHQMASGRLPAGERRAGSVGRAAGPDIAVMDEQGRLLPAGRSGEIVVRGPNVFDGYEKQPEANAASFTNGWFRTGDLGVIDGEGFVTIDGRLKEIINRGGEKISPREVDEALLEHEAVRQAVAFGIPHPLLGEDVGAAVVLAPGSRVTERELLDFVADRVAAFKVPAQLRIVEELPRGATGKLRRLDMARLLGLA